MKEPLLHVLVGPPGGGKSTYARAAFPADWIVCADDIRESMTPWRRSDPEESWQAAAPLRADVSRAIARALQGRLRAGLPTVYDNTNLSRVNRQSLLKLVPPGVAVRYYVIDRPLEAKLAARGWRPAGLIEQQHKQFQAELPAILAGDGRDDVSVEDLRSP